MKQALIARSGPLAGSIYPLEQRLIIGRGADADIQLLAHGVSRQHAAIISNDDGVIWVMDLASKNGTYIGDRSIGREQLAEGSRFSVAGCEFELGVVTTEPTTEELALNELRINSGPAKEVTEVVSPEVVAKIRPSKKD